MTNTSASLIPDTILKFRSSAINVNLQIVIPAAGIAGCQGFPVPHGATVRILAHNGTDTGNTKVIRVSDNPGGVSGPRSTPLPPNSEITYPVDNLGMIFIAGTPGDGALVSVKANN
jgi:hypothetical protein